MSREFKYIPDACSEEDAMFEGHVVLKKPSVDEANEASYLLVDGAAGESDIDKAKAGLDVIKKLREWSEKFYVSVDIKCVEDGFKYASLEDLKADCDTAPILVDVARRLARGMLKKKTTSLEAKTPKESKE